jgi:regulator of protease activity HflC (stomatin/prohibitin superfamily)
MLSLIKTTNLSLIKTTKSLFSRNLFTIIDQGSVGYREFFGYSRKCIPPGIRLYIPFIHKLKLVDMREGNQVLNLTACTKDNVLVEVTGNLFYKVEDAEKACFSVQDYLSSIHSIGISTIRSVIGNLDYDKINSERTLINTQLVDIIGKSIEVWGCVATKYEIQQFTPKDPNVAQQLILQMEAERQKRKNVLDTEAHVQTSEGNKQSAILVSEGLLIASKNKAEGDFLIEKRKADSQKYYVDATTTALVNQLEVVTRALNNDKDLAVKFLIEQKKLEHLSSLAQSKNNNTYFFPEGSLIPNYKVQGDMLAQSVNNKDVK